MRNGRRPKHTAGDEIQLLHSQIIPLPDGTDFIRCPTGGHSEAVHLIGYVRKKEDAIRQIIRGVDEGECARAVQTDESSDGG